MYIRTAINLTMKKLFVLLIFFFIALSCNDVKKSAGTNYLKEVVGKIDGEKLIVTNAEAIKAAWLSSGSASDELHTFEIIKGITQGDTGEEYYLLLSKNEEGDIKTGAMLILKEGKFYFEEPAEISAYIKITCSGKCTDGCNPAVKISEGNKYLVCSQCADCVKVESEMR